MTCALVILGCGSTLLTGANRNPPNPDGGACPVDPPSGDCSSTPGASCEYIPDGGSSCSPSIYFCDTDNLWKFTESEPPASTCPAALPAQSEACTNTPCLINVCSFVCAADAGTAVARCLGNHWQVEFSNGDSCGDDTASDSGASD